MIFRAAYLHIRHMPEHIIFAMQPDDRDSTGSAAFLTTVDGRRLRFAAAYPLEHGAAYLVVPTAAGSQSWYGSCRTRSVPCSDIIELTCGAFTWRR